MTTVEDYLRWLDRTIEHSGGFLASGHLVAKSYDLVEKLGVGFQHKTVVDQHELVFPGVGVLTFRMLLVEHADLDEEPVEVSVAKYAFGLRTERRRMLWRYDKHDGHPGVDECHVHKRTRWGHERVESCREVDLDDVVRIIQHDHMR